MDKITFQGGINSDDDHRVLPPGDYLEDTFNCRIGITDNGNNFSVENTKGNTLVSYTLPSGNSKTIGTWKDDLTSTITYFNYNDAANHHILQYSWVTNSITLILQSELLNFDVNHKITGINIIGGLLYWTDAFNEPQKLNIATASSGGYAPFIKDYGYAIKSPPLFPPTSAYVTDASKNANYLNNFLFQFKYRFFYDDYEKSAFSPISTVPLPQLDASSFTDTLKNNRIDILINTGSKIVTKIEIAARIGNAGDFFSIVILDKADKISPITTSTYTYIFYNDGVYNNINLPDSDKLFDNVPLLAKAQDLIDPTRITYGDITEGFDPIDIVAKLDVEVQPEHLLNGYSIHGKVRIRSPFSTATETHSPNPIISQPIWTTTPVETPRFGGFAPASPGSTDWHILAPIESSMTTDYGQSIPLGGFVFYLAGTSQYAVSKQKIIPQTSGLQYNDGVYVAGSGSGLIPPSPFSPFAINNIGEQIYGPSHFGNLINNDGALMYSDFTIKNVIDGTYILRVASHDTTLAELGSADLAYQKRSTYTVQVAGIEYYEATIKISNGTVSINGGTATTISGTIIELDDSVILDMSNAITGQYSNVMSGYLLDHDTTFVDNNNPTAAEFAAETKIELAQVNFTTSLGNIMPVEPTISNVIVNNWKLGIPKTYTDHNGFFFIAAGFFNSTPSEYIKISSGYTGNSTALNVNSGSVLGNSSLSWAMYPDYNSNVTPGSIKRFLRIRTPDESLFNNMRTSITTTFVDTAGAFNGVTMVISRGKWIKSITQNGSATILVYADTQIGATRMDNMYYNLSGAFIATFTPDYDWFNIGFSSTASGQLDFVHPYSGNYNLTFPLITTNVFISSIGKNATDASLKRGGWYQYGIVYYDHGNRSGTTNTNDYVSSTTSLKINNSKVDDYGMKLYIPFYTEPNIDGSGNIYGGAKVKVDWSIYHKPPIWATHYQWVRTLNTANNRYLQFLANEVKYVDNNNNVTTFALGTKIRIDMTNITNDFLVRYPNSTLVYDLIKLPSVDHVRMIRDKNGVFFNQYIDLQVLGYVNNQYLYLENKPGLIDFTGQNGMLFEVYNPKLQAQTLIWEIGEAFEIGDAGTDFPYHKGPTQNQIPSYGHPIHGISTSLTPATGSFTGGDTYYRLRSMGFSPSAYNTYFIEDASVSDFYISAITDQGRPNKIDNDSRQINRPSTIYYSELYIPETKINNLNSFYDTNFETYEQKYGSIQKLYNENHRLIAFQQLKVGQIPVNQNIVYDNTGASQIYSVAKVLNDIIYYAGEYGMTNPESFAVFGGSKYFVDTNRLAPLRLSAGGIDPIHENDTMQIKMHTYFVNKLALYNKYANTFIYGTYDKQFGNYVLAFEKIFIPEQVVQGPSIQGPIGLSATSTTIIPEQIISDGETIVFDEKKNRWRSKFKYNPDFMCQTNETIVSFKDGSLYVHNSNDTYNNFYGTQYTAYITSASRQNPSKVKTLQAISEETVDVWEAEISTENGQLATVVFDDFEEIENLQYSAIGRDENTANVVNPGIEGDMMRDTSFIIKLTNSLTTLVKIFAANIIYSDSERSNK